jgi:hypothetical protein
MQGERRGQEGGKQVDVSAHVLLGEGVEGPCLTCGVDQRRSTQLNRLDSLETVPFFRLFTREEGDIEHTGCGNTEHRDLKAEYCPDCHLACFALLKRVCHTQDLSKNAQLQGTLTYSCLCSLHFDVNHQCQAMAELCVEPLWYGEPTNVQSSKL